jgi:hypothetical protein
MFHITIVNFLIIHVAIYFIGNHIKINGWILLKDWTCNWLLNQWNSLNQKVKALNVNLENMP